MRKPMFLPIVLLLCMVQIVAFGAPATRGNARGSNNAMNETSAGTAPVAARAATRNAVKNTNTQTNTVSARAGNRQKVVSNPSANTAAPQPMAARAGSTQKVINNGTKVASAASNTVVSQECQDAFYGCMDSFCMIDNASGGRCQCSNRNDELLKVMDDIAKLDEQSYAMATEGVERIKMGEDADAVIARAKAAGDKVTGKADEETNKKKVRTLDLSAWNNTNIFSEDNDLFDEVKFDTNAVSDALSKTGAELYNSAAKMCVSQMPAQCSSSLNMLQSVYAQKIKSDCIAFENSLKQQKVASTQKLQTAEKALRDAALEKFREENKYATTGECVQAYAQCMESECGNDYSKCIQFAAEENIKGSKANEKSRTIKGVVDIILSGATMTQLMSKKTICDGNVLKYCVNHQSEVWGKYLEYAAPTLKSAEVNSEDNLRQNCIKDLSTCFQGACAVQFDPNKDEASYDMCLSDPEIVIDFCKVKLDACIVATGGKGATAEGVAGSRMWNGIKAMLGAMRVDACTKEVKSGIEAICGEDFSYCVGLNPGAIADLLPTDTLTACMEKNNRDRNKILQYVAEIAQGYALQINDKMYEVCENAAKQAMVSVCGDASTCDTLNLGNMSFENLLSAKLCSDTDCKNVNDFTSDEIIKGKVTPHIKNRINVNSIVYRKDISDKAAAACKDDATFRNLSPDAKLQCYTGFVYDLPKNDNGKYIFGDDFADPESAEVKTIIGGLTNIFNNKMAVMLKNKTVHDCMYGKSVTGFRQSTTKNAKDEIDVSKREKSTISNGTDVQDDVYVNLLDSYQEVLISKTLELMKQKYDKAEQDLQPQIDALNNEISQRLSSIEGVKIEEVHKRNRINCFKKAVDINVKNNTVGSAIPTITTDEESGTITLSSDGTEFTSPLFGTFTTRVGGCTNSGFCYKGERLFFDEGSGRNKARHALYWADAVYDETTSKCTVTTTKYACTYFLSPYCWGWDTTGVQDRADTEQMPVYNRERDLLGNK